MEDDDEMEAMSVALVHYGLGLGLGLEFGMPGQAGLLLVYLWSAE